MRKLRFIQIWILVILSALLMVGCGRERSGFVAPQVISTNPANLATGVPVTQIVTATFNTPINPTTVNTVTFTLAGPGGAALMGTVTYSGTTATFTPAANLLPSTTYTGVITTGATDPAGNPLATNFRWTFTTRTHPRGTSTIPVNRAAGGPVNQKISPTFSEPMNA